MTRGRTVASLAAEHPEWQPWLTIFGVARAAVDDPAWKSAVPAAPAGHLPLIDRTTFTIDASLASRFLGELLDCAGLPRVNESAVPATFEAAIAEDSDRLRALAVDAGADPERFATAAALAVVPLLQRCREAWQDRVPAPYMDAACPICGAWATLAEACGLERRLLLRCGRCGAAWAAQVLRCAFCATIAHEQLGTLVGETAGDTRKVDTCAACRGYMKTIATLTPSPPADVRLDDLATVDLDVAALSHGYARPPRLAPLSVHVTPRASRGRLASLARWRR
jgi:FdhE protein